MSKDQLLRDMTREVLQHPSPELNELLAVLKKTPVRTFNKLWQSLQPDEVVTWQELTRRLQQKRDERQVR
jgi:hypothetical protein